MRTGTISDGWNDLVDELKQLEAYLPIIAGDQGEREELEEDIEDLEQLIAAAGEPEDEHSMRALTYLQSELVRKRSLLDDLA